MPMSPQSHTHVRYFPLTRRGERRHAGGVVPGPGQSGGPCLTRPCPLAQARSRMFRGRDRIPAHPLHPPAHPLPLHPTPRGTGRRFEEGEISVRVRDRPRG